MEYYVFQAEQAANRCITAVNGSGWFPIIGNNAATGEPQPDKQQTIAWVEVATEMLSGEWAIPRIPQDRLDYLEVSQEDRDAFLAAFGQGIRDLTHEDFPQPVE
jgi:hypothetical protein